MNSATTQTPSKTTDMRECRGAKAVLHPRSGARRGQTIVIALLVLLLLAFLGGLFATIVTRNLANAARSNRVQSADYYAEAGIRFADDQLTDSLDGADWRPPLQNKLDPTLYPANNPTGATTPYTQEQKRYNAAVVSQNLAATLPNDPDKAYLDQGFTRYNIGGGRYLLRVTYDPVGLANQDNQTTAGVSNVGNPYSDPRARYIKIESVGREGAVDSKDPTTYSNAPRTQLNATLVQYKAIGITDYARFETNPDNRSDVMALGVASQYDTTAKGIVTSGVFDFSAPTAGSTTTLPLNPYPITTVYGSPTAYFQDNTTKQLIPNTDPNNQSAPTGYRTAGGGGSIHANGSVRFFGDNQIYLDNTNANSGGFADTVEVAGNLLLDNYDPAQPLTMGQDAAVHAVVNDTTAAPPTVVTTNIYPSNDNANRFTTANGAVRDGAGGNDSSGQPRSVNRLDPPTLDTVNPVTSLPRYAAIAKNAAPRNTEDSATATNPAPYTGSSPAAYGYGQAIYVDNSTDVQRESSRLVGGYTLIDEWLHRAGTDSANTAKGGWVANFYRPPGVDIVLGRQTTAIAGRGGSVPVSFYGVKLTRTDTDGAGSLIGWRNPDGTPISGPPRPDGVTQSTMMVSYKSLNASNDPTVNPSTLTGTALAAYQNNPNNDVTIYAEGNVRVHGPASAAPADTSGRQTTYAGNAVPGNVTDDDHLPRHITIVTNGTAYIDGNLVRGNPESSITVLAHDYVCVNTTQFLAGPIVDQNPAGTNPPGAFVGDLSLRALDFSASDEVLIQELSGVGANAHLYISGGPGAAGSVAADFDLINPRTGGSLNNANQPFTNALPYVPGTPPGSPPAAAPVPFFALFGSPGAGQPGLFRTTFDLQGALSSLTSSGVIDLAIRRTPAVYGQGTAGSPVLDPTATQDFVLERAAVLPMDIRIEATLFAQTRSFFVIPGEWFNTDTSDTMSSYAKGILRPALLNTAGTDYDDKNRFPFFGQPIDLKIIVDGSVSEARPADISAQSAWMAKWGWIPQNHGGLVTGDSTGTVDPSGHAGASFGLGNPLGVGLQIVYNPLAGFPYYKDPSPTATTLAHYLRTDIYGRPLPYAPKLPVCTGLLYAGQNNGESVLQ